MSEDHFTWSDVTDWLMDLVAFNGNSGLQRDLPQVESRDGQEPTVERMREEARQADAKMKSNPTVTLSSTNRKSLDKEFWETL